MDHVNCKKRNGQTTPTYSELKEDLKYNLFRKEELKKELRKHEEDNDQLRTMNFKNAEASLKRESVLKNLVDSLGKKTTN